MASQVSNYQCPACTGSLHFSPKTGRLTCEYCEQNYDVREIEALYAKKRCRGRRHITRTTRETGSRGSGGGATVNARGSSHRSGKF